MRHAAFAVALGACLPLAAAAEPLFFSSVTSNDIDYIHATDPDALACLVDRGDGRREMPDKRGGPLIAEGVHLFDARYLDGAVVPIWAHPALGDRAAALQTVAPLAQAIGKLPAFMRAGLDHVVVLKGDESAFAEDRGRFFVVYSDNVARRIATHDLEETVFHESVHATLDQPHARSEGWLAAQRADGAFLTGYGAENPEGEDLAETLLIAHAALRHPDRLPAAVHQALATQVPQRLAFLEQLLSRLDRPPTVQDRATVCG
ncbi:hypothetical protein [Marinovum sp.]|uniref:hypothetical protein n=1 Tax=Marinovum sp. TaxID=2024839 RepID=UPI002B27B13D|nr:hypothetical protein [Marinovum sp.]